MLHGALHRIRISIFNTKEPTRRVVRCPRVAGWAIATANIIALAADVVSSIDTYPAQCTRRNGNAARRRRLRRAVGELDAAVGDHVAGDVGAAGDREPLRGCRGAEAEPLRENEFAGARGGTCGLRHDDGDGDEGPDARTRSYDRGIF